MSLGKSARCLWAGGIIGGALMMVGAFSPWWQIGGGLFVPSTCSYWFAWEQGLAVVLAVAVFAGIIVQRPVLVVIAGGGTLPTLIEVQTLGLICSQAGCACYPMTGYSGPAYGLVLALAGSFVAIGTGVLWVVGRQTKPHS